MKFSFENLSSEDHTPAPIVENVENIIEPIDEFDEEEEEVNESSKRISGRIGWPGFTRKFGMNKKVFVHEQKITNQSNTATIIPCRF